MMADRAEILDHLIIGTGGASTSAAMALDRMGQRFEVLDVGDDLSPQRQQAVTELASLDPSQWDADRTATLFPPLVASAEGVDRRLAFGSDHPYRIPDPLSLHLENCATELSHARGGFGNVWGAAVLPYSDRAFRDWPVPVADMRDAYRRVFKYVPFSAEPDALDGPFPTNATPSGRLPRSGQVDGLLNALAAQQRPLSADGVVFGRARVAVDSSDSVRRCRLCARCLDGCVYGSMFNPASLWTELSKRHRVHNRQYAESYSEHEDHVSVTTRDLASGERRHWRTRRLFVGAGQFGTTRFLARSKQLFDRPIRIADSQYFFFPLISYRGFSGPVQFTLAELFIELLNSKFSDDYIHYQVYGRNALFEQTLHAMLPALVPMEPFARRFFLFQGYLHSRDSGSLELTLAGHPDRDDVIIRGIDNPDAARIARRSQALLRRRLVRFGLIPPMYLKMVLPGRSFHTGSSFPMGARDPIFSSDALGRPAGSQRVHIVDAANFPSIQGSTILLTAMANADRIATEVVTL